MTLILKRSSAALRLPKYFVPSITSTCRLWLLVIATTSSQSILHGAHRIGPVFEITELVALDLAGNRIAVDEQHRVGAGCECSKRRLKGMPMQSGSHVDFS